MLVRSSDPSDEDLLSYDVEQIFRHPSYILKSSTTNRKFDMALIKLAKVKRALRIYLCELYIYENLQTILENFI